MLRDLGWRDTVDETRLADVDQLDRRIERARAKLRKPNPAPPKSSVPRARHEVPLEASQRAS
jgi:hypothetical protein